VLVVGDEDVVGGTCSTLGREFGCIQIFGRKLKKNDQLDDISVDGDVLENNARLWAGFIRLRTGCSEMAMNRRLS
jgi:hypothetical protein